MEDIKETKKKDVAPDEVDQQEVLKALLTVPTEPPKKTVHMTRFGVDFVIRALSGKTIDMIEEQCTYYVGKGRKRKKMLDEQKFSAMIIVKGCVVPNWSDPQLLQMYNVSSPVDVVKARLLAGEIAKLSAEILDLSGFTDDEEEAEEEIKD